MRQFVDEGRRDPADRIGQLEHTRRDSAISFLYVIPKMPQSGLGLKLTQTPGSLQTAAKSRWPDSLAKARLQLFRMPPR